MYSVRDVDSSELKPLGRAYELSLACSVRRRFVQFDRKWMIKEHTQFQVRFAVKCVATSLDISLHNLLRTPSSRPIIRGCLRDKTADGNNEQTAISKCSGHVCTVVLTERIR